MEATLAPTVPRWVSRPMSTSGSAVRRSTATQTAKSTAEAANSPRMRAEVQPQLWPSVMPSNSVTRPPASRIAPGMSGRPPCGGVGSRRKTAPTASAAAARTAITQNTARKPVVYCAITPLSTRPIPLPMPMVALIMPMPVASFSRGRTPRTTPIDSGMTATEKPCTTLPTSSTGSEDARPAITEPASSMTNDASSIRRRPYMSPNRLNSGVATAPTSMLIVNVQLTAATPTFRSACRRGRSGSTALCCITVTAAPNAAAATTDRPWVGATTGERGDLDPASVTAAWRACAISTFQTANLGR